MSVDRCQNGECHCHFSSKHGASTLYPNDIYPKSN
jgi:hypothetical protein